jgi:hypothetical protein
MGWKRILASITGSVDQEPFLRKEYLSAENRILRAQLKRSLRSRTLSEPNSLTLVFRLGRKVLAEVATAQPVTILAWHRRLGDRTFNGASAHRAPGPTTDRPRR